MTGWDEPHILGDRLSHCNDAGCAYLHLATVECDERPSTRVQFRQFGTSVALLL